MIEAFEIGVALALETGDAQSALSGLAAQLSTLDQQMTDVQSRISQARAAGSGFVAPEKSPAFENGSRQNSTAPLNLVPDEASAEAKRPLQSEAGTGDLVQPPPMTWLQPTSQAAAAGAGAQVPAHDTATLNDGRGRAPSASPIASEPEVVPFPAPPKSDASGTAAYGVTQLALADALGIITRAAARESENPPQSPLAPSALESAPPRPQSFADLPPAPAPIVTGAAGNDASQMVPPLAANAERASVLGGFEDPALAPFYDLLQRAHSSASELQTPTGHEARSAQQVQPAAASGAADAPNFSGFQALEASLLAQDTARAGVVMPIASDLAPEWQLAHPEDSAVAQLASPPLHAAITLPPSLTSAGRLPTEANFDFGALATRQFGAVPVPPTFSQPENLSAVRPGQDQDSQVRETKSTRSQQEDNENQRDSPIVVHTNVHVDGDVVARAVTDRIFAALNGPLTGTGGFDSRRSYTPVES